MSMDSTTVHGARVYAHQMAKTIDHCLEELPPEKRAMLREWPQFWLEVLDLLSADTAPVVYEVEAGNVLPFLGGRRA
jgi:hypothetical protein